MNDTARRSSIEVISTGAAAFIVLPTIVISTEGAFFAP
jgi:hypothetical protein